MPSVDCMTSRGVVVHAGADGEVEVEFVDAPRCRGCEGACMWRSAPPGRRIRFATTAALREGDAVLVSLPARYVLAGSLLLHGVPWAALLAGGLAGWWITGTDLGCLLGAAAGLVATLLLMPGMRRRMEHIVGAELTLEPFA